VLIPEQDPLTGRFKLGHSGNAMGPLRRKQKLADRANTLAAEFGGLAALSGADWMLIHQCAELLLRKPEDGEMAVRFANTVSRILGGIRKRHGRRAKHGAANGVPISDLAGRK
jgi:hypothetical protein